MNRAYLILALLTAALLVSPFEVRAVPEMADFDHPEGLPDQASERAQEALDARGSHGGQDSDDGEGTDENPADITNTHAVSPSESVMIEHRVTNDVVSLNITIAVTPGEGIERTMDLDVNPPGTDKELPVGLPGDVPRGPPEDLPRGDGNGD